MHSYFVLRHLKIAPDNAIDLPSHVCGLRHHLWALPYRCRCALTSSGDDFITVQGRLSESSQSSNEMLPFLPMVCCPVMSALDVLVVSWIHIFILSTKSLFVTSEYTNDLLGLHAWLPASSTFHALPTASSLLCSTIYDYVCCSRRSCPLSSSIIHSLFSGFIRTPVILLLSFHILSAIKCLYKLSWTQTRKRDASGGEPFLDWLMS